MIRPENFLIRFDRKLVDATAFKNRLQVLDGIIIVLYVLPLSIKSVAVEIYSASI